jgi:hypothetical protein
MSVPAATVRELRDAIRRGDRTAVEICAEALARIEAHDGALHAFNTVTGEQALQRAALIDRDRSKWRDHPLAGIPVALKDNLCTRGVRTTASSRILESFVPPFDATAVSRLEAAGAVFIGKTNSTNSRWARQRKTRPWPDAQSLGDGSHPGRFERRFRRRGRGRDGAARARIRYRRFDSPACGTLRHRRAQAYLRSRVALRAARLRLFT